MRKRYQYLLIFAIIVVFILTIAFLYSNRESFTDSQQKIWGIAFGGGGGAFYDAVKRITSEMKETEAFHEIIGYTDNDLKEDTEFWEKHKDFVESNKRGYGYWLWKPYLIMKTLNKMNEGDILMYIDSGCEVIRNEETKQKIIELANRCNENNIIYTTTGQIEKKWMKMDLFKDMKLDEAAKESEQNAATAIIMKCSEITRNFTSDWYQLCCNYHYIDDSPSILENDPSFRDNRHDQTAFSLLLKTDKYKDILGTDKNMDTEKNVWKIHPFNFSRRL